ncbi:MAG: ABC transporter ATP-binding protein [Cyanobacteria bacterium P01_D01_bin.105]
MTIFNPVARSPKAASDSSVDNTDAAVRKKPALESVDLRKSYGRGKRRFEAVKGVSLSIEPGEVLAFLGPNGAGKTTTIKMIAGLIRPDAGWVRIAGQDPHRQPQALKGVGAVLEGNRNLYWRLTPLENLEYFGVLRQMPRRLARQKGEQLLETFGLSDKRHVAVQTLSRGMQQKIAIAVALVHDPSLLLLDEPTLGLDVESGETVKQLVRQVAASGCAILLTTHQLNVAEELSDRVAVIRAGQIVAEQPTAALIRAFSDSAAYEITVDGALSAAKQADVEAMGAVVNGDRIRFAADQASTTLSIDIYALLKVLAPLPLVEVRQDRADLTDVFLRLTRSEDTSK